MRRSLVAQHLRSCESWCRSACQTPDFCKYDEYKIQPRRWNPPFLDDIGLERQWADDTVQFLDNRSGFVRSKNVGFTYKEKATGITCRRTSVNRR